MPFIGASLIIILPVLYGTFLARLLFDRDCKWTTIYASGFLMMVLSMLLATLVSLKLDLDLEGASKIFLSITALGTVASLIAVVITIRQKNIPSIDFSFRKIFLAFIIPAVLLGIVSFLILVPSFANDTTWEIVSTTLATGKVYEYSAMTGKPMELGTAGLPIFNKVYVMPLFYSIMCHTFKMDMWFLGGILIPIIVYVVNINLVYLISGKLFADENNRSYFMVIYLMLLMAGTYLPIKGIPVTIGYAVLREGYSGYAIAYGILAPLVVYEFMNKKRVQALLMIFSMFGLVRIDRVVYALKEPITSLRDVNTAGKLVALYLAALFTAFIFAVNKQKKINWFSFALPSVAMSMVMTELKSVMKDKKERIVYSLGIFVIIYACVIFRPFNDAEVAKSFTKQDEQAREILNEIKKTQGEVNLWSSEEFMAEARRLDGSIKTLYGRDDMNVTLAGADYEPISEFVSDYSIFIKNKSYFVDYLGTKATDEEIVDEAVNEGVNAIVLSADAHREAYEELIEKAGFELLTIMNNKLIYIRKDIG